MTNVKLEWIGKEGHIANVILDRPEARNAFTTEMSRHILDIFRSIVQSDVRVVLLSSSNSRAFRRAFRNQTARGFGGK